MTVGQGALVGNLSYIGVGREVTFGTYATSTAGLNFLSASLKTSKDVKIIEEVQTSRTNSNYIQLGKTIEGEIEFLFSPKNLASNYILHNAFGGGPVVTATATGDTTGASSFTHEINIANFDSTYSSLSINMRKGDSASSKIFEYSGLRVNEFTLKAELDNPLIASAALIGKNSTTTSNDVSSSLNTLNQVPLSFINGRISLETSNSMTTTSYWMASNIELKLSNNLNTDTRRIGSDTIEALPAGMATFDFKATIRFDTLTAYNAMISGTRFYGQLEFLGDTMTGSKIREGIKLDLPFLIVKDAGDPEVGGPNEVLTSEVSFAVLRDPTTSGYALKATVTNNTSSYA